MTASTKALLALDGELLPAADIAMLRASHGVLIAADGAATRLRAMGIHPEVVIGDLDSLGAARFELAEAGTVVIEESSQESGDFEKALRWIAAAGWAGATVIGIGGGMIDHALNNFSVLARYAPSLALTIRLVDAFGWCVVERLELPCSPGDRVSLIPLPSALVTTDGLAWELHRERLAIAVREGASNRATGSELRIDVSEGVLLVIHFPTAVRRSPAPEL